MRILTIRFIQIAERLNAGGIRHRMTLMLDELKYHISRPTVEALGTVRSKGIRIIATIQSLADLRDVPADVPPEAFRGAVLDNCEVKIFYRSVDPDTADYGARLSGTKVIDQEARVVTRNAALAETIRAERTVRSIQAPLIDQNTFLHLPDGVAVVFDPPGLPRLVHVPVRQVSKSPTAVKVRPAPAVRVREPI
jgi:type IV secretory pathway TraG/TraD family ATPase VirD4